MKSGIIFILGAFLLHAGQWSAPSAIAASQAASDVTGCFHNAQNQFFAAWEDKGTQCPMYAIYANGAWSAPLPISTASHAAGLVTLCFDSIQNQIFAAWEDQNTSSPFYAIYKNGAWSAPLPIANEAVSPSKCVTLCFDTTSNQMFAVWVDNSTRYPQYAIYQNEKWSEALALANTPVYDKVHLAFDSAYNQTISTWGENYEGFAPRAPFYSIYRNGAWSPAAHIEDPCRVENVSVCFDPTSGKIMGVWNDLYFGIFTSYAYFHDSSWEGSSTLPKGLPYSDLDLIFSANQMVVAGQSKKYLPVAAIYQSGSWGAVTPLSSAESFNATYLCCDPTQGQIIAMWIDEASERPFYSLRIP